MADAEEPGEDPAQSPAKSMAERVPLSDWLNRVSTVVAPSTAQAKSATTETMTHFSIEGVMR
jgi:hypothetical protein